MRETCLFVSMVFASTAASADSPRVAVDIAPVHSIVAAVMEGVGTPDLIVPPGASPHDHSLRPSEARALDQADVIVWMGHSLTPWLEGPIDTLGAGADKIELMDLPETIRLEIREGAAFGAHDHDHGHADGHTDEDDHANEHADDHGDDHADDHGHDHADEHGDEHRDEHGDDHADDHANEHKDDHADAAHKGHTDDIDPHAWLDPHNAVIWAGEIAHHLSEIDPENGPKYVSNAESFEMRINGLVSDIELELSSVSDRPFVVFHDAYQYFEARFGIAAVGAVSASDAQDPSPRRVAELRDEIAEYNAACALTEPQFNPGIISALGDVKSEEIDPIGTTVTPGPDLYATVIRSMSASLAACLE